MDEVFKALADASRRSLLDRLHAENGQTLNDLCDGLAMTRQAVTKHLAILEAANLVTTFRQGREKLHYLNPVPIHQIGERWIRKFERGKLTALSELKRQLEKRDELTGIRLRYLYRDIGRETVAGADRRRLHRALLVRRAASLGMEGRLNVRNGAQQRHRFRCRQGG